MDSRLRARQRASASANDLGARLAEVREMVRGGQRLPDDVMLAARLGHPELAAVVRTSMWWPEVASVVRAGRHAVRIQVSPGHVAPAEPARAECGVRLNPCELGGQEGGWPTCEGCIRHARWSVYTQVGLWGWVQERRGYFSLVDVSLATRLWRSAHAVVRAEYVARASAVDSPWIASYAPLSSTYVYLQRLPDGTLIVDALEDLAEGTETLDHLPERLIGPVALYALAYCSMFPADMAWSWGTRAPKVAKDIWPGS